MPDRREEAELDAAGRLSESVTSGSAGLEGALTGGGGVGGISSENVASGLATRAGGLAAEGVAAGGSVAGIFSDGFASGLETGLVGFAAGGGAAGRDSGASEIVAPSSGSRGVLPAELSPLAGTPTPCLPPTPRLGRLFLDLGSSIKRHIPQVVMSRQIPS